MSPSQFAKRIVSKYAPFDRGRAKAPQLVLLAHSTGRWIHFQRDRVEKRYLAIGSPTLRSPVVQLIWNDHPPTTLHHTQPFPKFTQSLHTQQARMTAFGKLVWERRQSRVASDMYELPLHRTSPLRISEIHMRRLNMTTQQELRHRPKSSSFSSVYAHAKNVTMQVAMKKTSLSNSPSIVGEERRVGAMDASPPPTVMTAPAIDMKRLTDEVYQAIERKLRIERQRKGL